MMRKPSRAAQDINLEAKGKSDLQNCLETVRGVVDKFYYPADDDVYRIEMGEQIGAPRAIFEKVGRVNVRRELV